MKALLAIAFAVLLIPASLFAQADLLQERNAFGPKVEQVQAAPVSAVKGRAAKFAVTFRVSPGFHVNSNKPNSDLLIPTSLKLDAPSDIVIGRLQYPAGKDVAFEFSPNEKLNVYDGDFTITGLVTTPAAASPGAYRVRGELTYQACDNRQCFPPKKSPVQFDVNVQSAAKKVRRNPGQSPHVHR